MGEERKGEKREIENRSKREKMQDRCRKSKNN
jgi:hypothetical protein